MGQDFSLEDILQEYDRGTGKARKRRRGSQRHGEPVDIRNTASRIRRERSRLNRLGERRHTVSGEKFPTQKLERDSISYLAGRRQDLPDAPPQNGYDGAVRTQTPTILETQPPYQPKIRPMEEATRAKERANRHRRRATLPDYAKETAAVYHAPETAQESAHPQDDTEYRAAKRRMRSATGTEYTAKDMPDNMDAIEKVLRNLRSVIFFRFITLLLLTLAGAVLAFSEAIPLLGGLYRLLGYRAVSLIEIGLAVIAGFVTLPTLLGGLKNLFLLKADSDTMAILPFFPALAGAVLCSIYPQLLSNETVHLFVPCALLCLLCNAGGKILVIRRAMRNCAVVSRRGEKLVLHYVDSDETAESFTRGIIRDFPILTAMQPVQQTRSFLRYTYSMDTGDMICRRAAPLSVLFSLLCAVVFTLIRQHLVITPLWFGFFLSMFTLFLTASCCAAAELLVNLPLERETKRNVRSGDVMLGYQSVDDFYDSNALLLEARDFFPMGTVKIQQMRPLNNMKIDEVILDAASLTHEADSILWNGFAHMLADPDGLAQVKDFACEDNLGLCGWIHNRRILLGGRDMMLAHHVEGIPSTAREREIITENGEILYLSVSGTAAAVFAVEISADEQVGLYMHELRAARIALAVHNVDAFISEKRLSDLFGYPEQSLRILPSALALDYARLTQAVPVQNASMMTRDGGFGAARLLLSAKRVRRSIVVGSIVLLSAVLLGVLLALIHISHGAYAQMNAEFFILFHIIEIIVTAIAVHVRYIR